MSIYQPYTYLIGWTNLNKFYYGVRYKRRCSPSDFWKSYFTSSKIVKKYRELYGEPDIIEIRKTFDCPHKAKLWESKVLTKLDCARQEKWINRNNCDGKFHTIDGLSEETKQKLSQIRKGKPKSEEWKAKIGAANKGKIRSAELRKQISEKQKGRKQPPRTDQHKINLSLAHKGKSWWTNGLINKFSHICPPGFYKGTTRIKNTN